MELVQAGGQAPLLDDYAAQVAPDVVCGGAGGGKHLASGGSSRRQQSTVEGEPEGLAAGGGVELEDGGENCWIAAGQDVCPWEDE
jgi:hypothetical protein